jgi:protein phosphatase
MEILETKTDTGLIRSHNEDAVLTIKHPKNKNIKLLIVADGMGGKAYGEVAANYTVESINKWFKEKTIKELNNREAIDLELNKLISDINKRLIKKYGENTLGTTLTMAIINKTETIILNIGDSRAYIYKNKRLIQVTEDDSDVWLYYKYKEVKKDDLRYFVNNNIITSCLGLTNDLCKATTYVIPNDYDILLLFTDGVTDLITDKKILKIIKETKKQEILKRIIYEAVYIDQKLKVPLLLRRKKLSKYIVPINGRDNASGAIYIKEV